MVQHRLVGTWLVTGLRGTVAPKVAVRVAELGGEVAAWDRDAVPIDDVSSGAAYLASIRPAGIFHLAMGAEEWAGRLAFHALDRGVPFVYVSSGSVFGNAPADPDGPFRPADEPTARDDYGRYKASCERAVRAAHEGAVIARIGWQADPDGRGNNMAAQLAAQAEASSGVVRASRLWRPASSWMGDTAAALVDLATSGRTGTVHLEATPRTAGPTPTSSGTSLTSPATTGPSRNSRSLTTTPASSVTRTCCLRSRRASDANPTLRRGNHRAIRRCEEARHNNPSSRSIFWPSG